MNTAEKLDYLLQDPPVTIQYIRPMIFIGDCHMGDGGPADDFAPNAFIFRSLFLPYYRSRGFDIWYPGDRYELYQFTKEEIRKAYPDLWSEENSLEGNHDASMKFLEALLINSELGPILVVHGHQREIFQDQYAWVGRLFTKLIWKPLEYLGLKDPPPSVGRHSKQRLKLIEWANSRQIMLIHNHMHLLEHNGFEWDCGWCGTPGELQCVELEGKELKLVRWTDKGREEL